ncbi:serine--tRNA ligase [Candidatus Woesearchaeota archaeon]|nr:serine--tRNA ligase [Candidatus Woesearchaeota archaeon]
MIDINLIRNEPAKVKANLKKRKDPELLKRIDLVKEKDEAWRKLTYELQELRHKKNTITLEIRELKKKGQKIDTKNKEMKALPKKIADTEEKEQKLRKEIRQEMMRIPNLLHETVPYGKDADDNAEVRKWGVTKKPGFDLKNHIELAEQLGVVDFDRSSKLAGSGFYFLKGELAMLNQALVRFAIDFMVKKGYTLVEPPLMMNKKSYEGVVDLGDFETVMYKIEGDDLYLIATSEHPLVGQYMDEVIDEKDIPMKLVGYSMCFRREIGAHGIDTKGLFRRHQFSKVEQVIICKPEDSWKLHEELVKNGEDILKALKIPYRVVNVCTGDLGTVAAKKYDTEYWSPRQQKYCEIFSASNCTDYQTRRLNIRCGKIGGQKTLTHSLNATALPTSTRALVAILENCQQKDGTVKVPDVLVPYMLGIKVIGKPKKEKKPAARLKSKQKLKPKKKQAKPLKSTRKAKKKR